MSKLSEAQKRAKNKYNKKSYKQFNVKLKPFQMDILENYCNKYGYSKNNFAILSLKEKMEKDTGKNFDEFLQEQEPQELRRSAPSTAPSAISPEPAAPDEPAKPPEVNKGNQ